jgi:putative sigma-54 modulation protein
VDLVLRGRGIRITDQIRRSAEHKLGKIERLDPRVAKLEVEVIGDLNPRVGASHRIEVACDRGRRRFRATGSGNDVDSALDQVVERLERQISTYRGKLRHRLLRRGNRLQSQQD